MSLAERGLAAGRPRAPRPRRLRPGPRSAARRPCRPCASSSPIPTPGSAPGPPAPWASWARGEDLAAAAPAARTTPAIRGAGHPGPALRPRADRRRQGEAARRTGRRGCAPCSTIRGPACGRAPSRPRGSGRRARTRRGAGGAGRRGRALGAGDGPGGPGGGQVPAGRGAGRRPPRRIAGRRPAGPRRRGGGAARPARGGAASGAAGRRPEPAGARRRSLRLAGGGSRRRRRRSRARRSGIPTRACAAPRSTGWRASGRAAGRSCSRRSPRVYRPGTEEAGLAAVRAVAARGREASRWSAAPPSTSWRGPRRTALRAAPGGRREPGQAGPAGARAWRRPSGAGHRDLPRDRAAHPPAAHGGDPHRAGDRHRAPGLSAGAAHLPQLPAARRAGLSSTA